MIIQQRLKETEIGMIPEDWEVKDLQRVAVFRNGRSSPTRLELGKFPVYGSNGIIGFADETNSEENTIVIGRVGAYCGSVYFSKTKCWVTDNAIIGLTKDDNSPQFLFYLLKKLDLNKQRAGSSQPLINQSILNSLKSAFPPSSGEQKAISKVLYDLDSKIELSQQMNRTLEAIGKAVFKHWFVEFEFTNEEGKPYKSSGGEMVYNEELCKEIPKGWSVFALHEVCEFAYGEPLKEDSRRIGSTPVYGSNGQIGWHDKPLVKGPGIVVGRKGNPGVVTWVQSDFFPIDTTFYVVPEGQTDDMHYLFHVLSMLNLSSLASDSAVPGLNRNIAYTMSLFIPPLKLLNRFEVFMNVLTSKVHRNNQESNALAMIRDLLLPKLMSGKIRVPVEVR